MPDIDQLSIQISASATQATTAIDKIISRLGSLKSVMQSAAPTDALVQGLEHYGESLSVVAQSVNQLANGNLKVVSKSIDSLVNATTRLATLDVGSTATSMEELASGIAPLEGVHITADQFSGISTLVGAMGKLGGQYSANAASSLPFIAEGLENIAYSASMLTPEMASDITALGMSIGTLGSKAATRAQGLPFVAEGLRQIAEIGSIPHIEGLDEFSASLKVLGGAKATQATKTIPELANAYRQLIETLATAPTVKQNTIDLANALARLGSVSGSTSASMRTLTGSTNLFGHSAGKVRHHAHSLAATFGKLYASYFLVIRAFRALGKAVDVSASLTEVQNVVNVTFGQAKDKVQEFTETSIREFGMAELAAKQYSSRFQAMGSAMGISSEQIGKASDFLVQKLGETRKGYDINAKSMADMSINLTKLTADMASFYNMDYADVAKDLESVMTGMTRPLRKFGLDLTNATLQEWALKNGLDADIKSMSQAEKTMLRYQYVMAQTGHIMGDFYKTADNWANVVRTIGQQFEKLGSIIGTGIINAFKPFLLRFREFMNTLIDLTEKGLNAIGKLLGWQIEIEDVGITMADDMEDYEDALGGAADNAKKLKSQLRGIDELNNLTTTNGNGGGGASGGGASLGDMSKVTGGVPRVEDYKSDIDSWFELGRRIADKIQHGLDRIDWDKVYGKAKNFGKNFAEFLNGLIKPETFYSVGRTIAGALNTAIQASLTFADTFDFKNLGESLANGVNGFFETFNFKKLAQSINKWVQGIAKTITTFVKKIKWKEVFKGFYDFFSNLDIATVGLILGAVTIKKVASWHIAKTVFTSLANTVATQLFGNKNIFVGVGEKLGVKLVAGIKAGVASGALGAFAAVTAAVGGLLIFAKVLKENYDKAWDKEQVEDYGDTIDNIKDKVDNLNKSIEDGMAERKSKSDTADTDIAYISSLYDQYRGLSEKVGKTADDYTKMKLIASELVETVPELEQYYNSSTGLLDVNNAELERLIENKRTEIALNAVQENWSDALKQQIEYEKQLAEQKELVATAEEKKKEAKEAYDKVVEKGNPQLLSGWTEESRAYSQEFNAASDRLKKAETEYDELKGVQTDMAATYAEILNEVDYYEKKFTEYSKAQSDVNDQFQTTSEKTADATENLIEYNNAAKEIPESLQKAEEAIGSFKDGFSNDNGKEIGENFGDGIVGAVEEKLGKDNLLPIVETSNGEISKSYEGLAEDVSSTFDEVERRVALAVQNIQNDMNFEWSLPMPKVPKFKIEGEFDFETKKVPEIKVEWFAEGGYPTPGSLFVAGEAGAEMLGTVGGRTAVAGGEEITGIREAIYSTADEEVALLRQQNQLLSGILQKEFGISSDDIFRSVRSSARDYENRTGSPAFG